ncbi:MAG: alpha-D-ribose 1-methylphosphonate 5-triphosphate diphosphatase, partial [Pseudomonadota bacterium]
MWLSDFTLVLPDRLVERGSLRIEGGRIAEIVETPVAGGLGGDGLHLTPGAVDMHGDMIEQEIEPRTGVDMPMPIALASLDGRLAEAGATTAYASVSFSRAAKDGERRSAAHTASVIRDLHGARDGLRVDHRIHARFDIVYTEALGDLRALVEAGMIDLVSLMDHTPGQGQYRNAERFIDYLKSDMGLSDAAARARADAKIADREAAEPAVMAVLREVSQLCRAHALPMASHDDDTEAKTALMAEIGCAISEFPVTEAAARSAVQAGMAVAMG